MAFSERLKLARQKANLTQAELARKAGLATGSIYQYEAGLRFPRLEILYRIADALGCSMADLDESLAISATELADEYESFVKEDDENRKRIDIAYSKLNAEGRAKAAERLEELAEIKRFRSDPNSYNKAVQRLKRMYGSEVVQEFVDLTKNIEPLSSGPEQGQQPTGDEADKKDPAGE